MEGGNEKKTSGKHSWKVILNQKIFRSPGSCTFNLTGMKSNQISVS